MKTAINPHFSHVQKRLFHNLKNLIASYQILYVQTLNLYKRIKSNPGSLMPDLIRVQLEEIKEGLTWLSGELKERPRVFDVRPNFIPSEAQNQEFFDINLYLKAIIKSHVEIHQRLRISHALASTMEEDEALLKFLIRTQRKHQTACLILKNFFEPRPEGGPNEKS